VSERKRTFVFFYVLLLYQGLEKEKEKEKMLLVREDRRF
jgi:hypothetical protein